MEEFQWAEMQSPSLLAEPPKIHGAILGLEISKISLHHALSSLNCTVQREPSASYQTSTLSKQELIIMARIIPFPVPPLYQLSVIFGQNDSTASYLVNRARLQLQL